MIQPGSKILTMSDTLEHDWLPEAEIATRLNVSRDILKKRRPHLPAGTVKAEGKVVLWRLDAARTASIELGLPDAFPQKKAADAPSEATAAASVEEDLLVSSNPRFGRFHFRNPNIIQARRKNGELVYVRVVSSGHYQPQMRNGAPMLVRAKKSPESNLWLRSGRDPRWPGQW
jgi:hypothetical protein